MVDLVFCAEQRDDLFGVNDPDELLIVIDDRERTQVVLIEQFGYFSEISIDVTA